MNWPSQSGPSTDYFRGLAKQHKLHLVFSLYERDGHSYNTAVLVILQGQLVGKYRKGLHFPHGEVEKGIMPGHKYPVFETRLGKIGMMICYDGFFPEVARGTDESRCRDHRLAGLGM